MGDPAFRVIGSTDKRSDQEREALLAEPGFGQVFTDHMVTINWNKDIGWHDAQLRPQAPFSIHPATVVLHYGQEIFEGMKAYRRDDGSVNLFRPDDNARRFNASATRMKLPELPEALFLESIYRLIDMDRDWVPQGECSLYVRPFMFANDITLGVQPPDSCIFCVIASPAGAYYSASEPLSVWVTNRYARAADGGTGAAKCGGNYAGGLIAQAEAYERGCDQVIFLDAAEHRWIEELGNMNVFFVMDDGLIITPSLGTILPGVTRLSIIDLARSEGHQVTETRYSFDEWAADAATGRLREVFACGTAATVVGVSEVRSENHQFTISDGQTGPVTKKLRSRLLDIQRGHSEDPFGWCKTVPTQAREVA